MRIALAQNNLRLLATQFLTEIEMPAGELTPPISATMGWSPSGKVGTTTLNWYSPTATSPANGTAAGTPPMRMCNCAGSEIGGAPLKACPAGTAGLVGPKPVP